MEGAKETWQQIGDPGLDSGPLKDIIGRVGKIWDL